MSAYFAVFSVPNSSTNRDSIKAEVMVTKLPIAKLPTSYQLLPQHILGYYLKLYFLIVKSQSHMHAAQQKLPLLSKRQWDLTAMSILLNIAKVIHMALG